MDKEDFGSFLREARERRRLSTAEISEVTKVSESTLRLLEMGDFDALPPEIFVRGFIRSYAQSVGISEVEPLGMFERAVSARNQKKESLLVTPAAGLSGGESSEEGAPRRGIGLAVFVIIVLLIATITLSLFLRQPPQAGEGLSQAVETLDVADRVIAPEIPQLG